MPIRILALLGLVAVLTGCGTFADPSTWFDDDEASKPAELVDFEPRIRPRVLWSQNLGDIPSAFPQLMPAIDHDAVYVIDGEGRLSAIGRENGERLWTLETGLAASAGPTVGEGILVVGSREGEIVAFSVEDGQERWRQSLSSSLLARPAIAEGWVVAHTEDGNLFGLDSASGEIRWRYDHKVPVLTLHGSSAPVIDSGQVFCGLAGGKLIALSLDDGLLEWEARITVPRGRTDIERMVDVDADPLVYSGTVYAAAYQGHVAAVGTGSGKIFWSREMSVYNNMAVNWQQLVVSDAHDRVWSLDPDSGSARWRQEHLRNRRVSAPALLEDYVVIGDFEGYLHWLSADDGAFVARTRVSGEAIVAPPQVVDDVLYVLASDGKLTALGLANEEGEN